LLVADRPHDLRNGVNVRALKGTGPQRFNKGVNTGKGCGSIEDGLARASMTLRCSGKLGGRIDRKFAKPPSGVDFDRIKYASPPLELRQE
jgi:hypothetical protein